MRRLVLLSLACLSVVTAGAQASCSWESVARQQGVNPLVLYEIAGHESGRNPSAIRHNKDGSIDYGLMQINSVHLPELGRYGIGPRELMDSCINLQVGAWLLARRMAEFGNTWSAIGAYHSKTPARRDKYSQKIYERLQRNRRG